MSNGPLHNLVSGVFQRLTSFGRRKPPAYKLGAFFVMGGAALGLWGLWPCPLYAAHTTAPQSAPHRSAGPHKPHNAPTNSVKASPPHKLTLQEKLEEAEQALAHEQDDKNAQNLLQKTETLRLFSVKNAGRLLLSEAQDALKNGHADQADASLSAALTLQPDNAFLRRQRAAIRYISNDFTGAVQDLEVALIHDPGDAQAWDLLAHTQEQLHHPREALHAFTEALTHAPLLPGGEKRYEHLDHLANGTPD